MRNALFIVAAMSVMLAPPASRGDAQKGLDAFQSGDYETALAAWQPLAEAGDAEGQFGLGQMYGNGFGVAMDDAQAIKWYGLASGQGHAEAQCKLAVMHQNGWGVPQSDAEAMKLFSLAAEQGVSEAMLALGRFYAMDYSDDYDPLLAYKWFSLAYLRGDSGASAKRDTVADSLSAEQIAAGDALILAWSEAHADLIVED